LALTVFSPLGYYDFSNEEDKVQFDGEEPKKYVGIEGSGLCDRIDVFVSLDAWWPGVPYESYGGI